MTVEFIQTSIGSYNARLEYEERRAINAIAEHDYQIAALAISEAAKLDGAIKELEFLLEAMETEA